MTRLGQERGGDAPWNRSGSCPAHLERSADSARDVARTSHADFAVPAARVPRLSAVIALLAVASGCSVWLDGEKFDDPFDGGGQGSRRDAGSSSPADAAADAPDARAPEPDAGPAACTDVCPGGDCELHCEGPEGCACQLDCAGTDGKCKARCEAEDCTIDCRDVNNCEPECRRGSTCSIDCTGANNCEKVKCADDSGCLLDCSGSNNCEFEECRGEVSSCPGDVLACNRDCP